VAGLSSVALNYSNCEANFFGQNRTEKTKNLGSSLKGRKYTNLTNSNSYKNMLRTRLNDAKKKVNRVDFLEGEKKAYANVDAPIPIGEDQTTSQPSLIDHMILLLELSDGIKDVLEIGTGSGYQTAILAHLVKNVYSIEREKKLSDKAIARLKKLGFVNIHIRNKNGVDVWGDNQKFDRIIVSAACSKIYEAFITQLKPGGILVLPLCVGKRKQRIVVIKKGKNGKLKKSYGIYVRFVPFIEPDAD
jgi:protein-L-isoaspartate(D-aspartate) O-methyltransferase